MAKESIGDWTAFCMNNVDDAARIIAEMKLKVEVGEQIVKNLARPVATVEAPAKPEKAERAPRGKKADLKGLLPDAPSVQATPAEVDELTDLKNNVTSRLAGLIGEAREQFNGGLLANHGTDWDQRADWNITVWRGAWKLLQTVKK